MQGKGRADRTNQALKPYATAAVAVAKELRVPYLDMFEGLMSRNPKGWELSDFAADGLHLSIAGNRAVFELLVSVIQRSFPQYR